MYKKRWYDGLQDIYEGKNEFEIKFGCFGGDGGGGGSSTAAQDPNDVQNAPSSSPSTGFRGEQSAGSPSSQGYSGPTGVGIGPGSTGTPSGNQTAGMTAEQAQANENISNNIAAAISANQAVNNPLGSINDFFAVNEPQNTSPNVSQNVSFSAPVSSNISATGLVSDQLSQATDISQAQQNLNDYLSDISNTPSFSAPVNTGFSIGVPAGTTISNPGISIGYTGTFAKGGAVNQGIGSVFPYPRRR